MKNIIDLVALRSSKKLGSKAWKPTKTTKVDTDPCLVSPLPTLSPLQTQLLERVAEGLGIRPIISLSSGYREFWTIGSWMLDSGVSISIWMISPNISSCTLATLPRHLDALTNISQELNNMGIPNSKCYHKIHNGTHQFMGRLVPELCKIANNRHRFGLNIDDLCFVNMGGSILSMWIRTPDNKSHLCTISQQSAKVLMRYLPVGFGSNNEHGRMSGISIRKKGSKNNLTQLLIGAMGTIQYNGAPIYIESLYGALADSICAMMDSGAAGQFMSTLTWVDSFDDD